MFSAKNCPSKIDIKQRNKETDSECERWSKYYVSCSNSKGVGPQQFLCLVFKYSFIAITCKEKVVTFCLAVQWRRTSKNQCTSAWATSLWMLGTETQTGQQLSTMWEDCLWTGRLWLAEHLSLLGLNLQYCNIHTTTLNLTSPPSKIVFDNF